MIRSMGGSLEAEFEKQKEQRRRQEHKNMEDQMRKNRIDRVFLDKEYTHVEWMRRRNLHEYDLAQEKIIDQLARIYARQCQIAEEKLAKKEEEERKKRLRIEQREKAKTKRPKTTDSSRSRRSQLTPQFSRTSLVGRPATSSFPRSQGPAERAQTPMSEPRVARRGSLSKAMPPRSQSRVSFAQGPHRTAWGDDDSDRISEISDLSSSSDETRSPPMKVEVRSLAPTPAQKGGKNGLPGSVGPSVPPATTISQPNPFQKKRLVTPPTILVLHQKLDLYDGGGDKNQKGNMHRLSPAEQDFIRKKYRQKHECLMQERQRRLKARAQSAPPAAQVERNRFNSVSRIEELNLKSSSEKPWVEYWREKLLS